MEDLSEIYKFLKGKSKDELIRLIEKNAKQLVNDYGNNADLEFKEQIRMLDNLNEWNGYFLRERLGKLINREVEKNDKEKLMTVEEVALELGVTGITVRNWIRGGVIVAERLGVAGKRNVIRFKREEVERVKGNRE
jgi:excisionase family DNA binding protein